MVEEPQEIVEDDIAVPDSLELDPTADQDKKVETTINEETSEELVDKSVDNVDDLESASRNDTGKKSKKDKKDKKDKKKRNTDDWTEPTEASLATNGATGMVTSLSSSREVDEPSEPATEPTMATKGSKKKDKKRNKPTIAFADDEVNQDLSITPPSVPTKDVEDGNRDLNLPDRESDVDEHTPTESAAATNVEHTDPLSFEHPSELQQWLREAKDVAIDFPVRPGDNRSVHPDILEATGASPPFHQGSDLIDHTRNLPDPQTYSHEQHHQDWLENATATASAFPSRPSQDLQEAGDIEVEPQVGPDQFLEARQAERDDHGTAMIELSALTVV